MSNKKLVIFEKYEHMFLITRRYVIDASTIVQCFHEISGENSSRLDLDESGWPIAFLRNLESNRIGDKAMCDQLVPEGFHHSKKLKIPRENCAAMALRCHSDRNCST